MEFTNLKIEIFLENSVAMQKNKAAFDSILAMLYFNDQKNKGTFNGDYEQHLDFLDMTDGVYHTSYPIFNGVKYYDKEKLIKKFDHEMYAKYGEITSKNGKARGVVDTTTAKYKNEFYSIERIGVTCITYYVRGNQEVIERLLKKLQFIGKKSSLGWGKVKYITIEEIKTDCSIFKDNKLMRNIRLNNAFGYKADKVKLSRLTHPYWSKTDLVECLVP
jgi:hypothetical protein